MYLFQQGALSLCRFHGFCEPFPSEFDSIEKSRNEHVETLRIDPACKPLRYRVRLDVDVCRQLGLGDFETLQLLADGFSGSSIITHGLVR